MLNNHGGEIDLDGTNDYIQLNDPFSHQDHTIEMWIKMKDNGNDFLWDARDADNDGYILFNLRLQIVINYFNDRIIPNLTINQWVQVIATHTMAKNQGYL